jgi:DNA-directed DNA polymerase III PolC
MFLNCHSYFSLRFGVLSIPELIDIAEKNGARKIVLSDVNNTSGVIDFIRRCKKSSVEPVAGIDFRNNAEQKFIGIAKNNKGFLELNRFLSRFLHDEIPVPDSAPEFEHSFVVYPFSVKFRILRENEFIGIKETDLNKLNFSQWKNYPEKLVILSPVSFRHRTDFNCHRLLRSIANNTLLSKLPVEEQASPDEIMIPEFLLKEKFRNYHQLVYNTEKLLDQCEIDFEFGTSKNKKYYTGNRTHDEELLKKLCTDNLEYRYKIVNEKVSERLEHEIDSIISQGYVSYFLINWDIVSYARHRGFYYVGRGSGANSIVAYLLRITDVDPVDLDLYFERFMNPYRTSPPDFDLDFSWKDRDEIISYIFKKHKNENTSLLATYSTFQENVVVRELGKVFGLPKNEIDGIQLEGINNQNGHILSLIKKYSTLLNDFPNHLSIHAGGILISELPIHYYTATNMPPKGFPLSQFSMIEAEDVGLYKFDILSQRGLGHIKDALQIIKENRGVDIDIHDIQSFKQDEKIKDLLRNAKCMGCFYVESPAMRMLLKKLEADTYIGLVAASSIIRPGVASSGMMREYILRSKGLAPSYQTPQQIYELLSETYGVMVYQEDVIKVAHYFAGLTLGEADMLRRGMSGKYRGREEFKTVRQKFFDNCKEKGYADQVTNEVWRQIESFAGYAFSKGHSASYAVESYQSLFLKAYYPVEHMVAVINNFGGFYRTEYYFHEARMRGANVLQPNINNSDYFTCVKGKNIYPGFIHIAELEQKVALSIIDERTENGHFSGLEDFMKRVNITAEQLRLLIRAGAFTFTGRTKKQLLWDIHTILGKSIKTEVKKELFEVEKHEFKFPELYQHELDDAFDERELLGFCLRSPFDLLMEEPESKILATDFPQLTGQTISIIGYLVTTKPTSTKHHERMMFGTFIDPEGNFFDTTHFPKVYYDYPLRGKGSYLITGKIAEEFGFCSIDVISIKFLESYSRETIKIE